MVRNHFAVVGRFGGTVKCRVMLSRHCNEYCLYYYWINVSKAKLNTDYVYLWPDETTIN